MFKIFAFILILNLKNPEVGIVEKLGNHVPEDIVFVDSKGLEFTFSEFKREKKPYVLTPIYYSCQSVCPALLSEIVNNLEKISAKPFKDFYVITFSFDVHDNFEFAKEQKKNYLTALGKKIDERGWKFVVPKDSVNLYKLTESIGFYFKRKGKMFVHPTVMVFLSPDLKITRYLYGPEFLPFDFEMALYEASQGKLGGIRIKATKFCFNYDPKGRKYVFDFVKVFMIFSMVFVFSFAIFLSVWIKKSKRED